MNRENVKYMAAAKNQSQNLLVRLLPGLSFFMRVKPSQMNQPDHLSGWEPVPGLRKCVLEGFLVFLLILNEDAHSLGAVNIL